MNSCAHCTMIARLSRNVNSTVDFLYLFYLYSYLTRDYYDRDKVVG